MGLKTPEEYRESLKDGRVVFLEGERIEDMEASPSLKVGIEECAVDYRVAMMPEHRELLVTRGDDGKPYHFVFKPPADNGDIMRRRKIIQLMARTCLGLPGGAKFTGVDALHALTAVCRKMDRELETPYGKRVEAFREELKEQDAAVAVAMTDVKGDRSLRPSRQEEHQDYYLRIVKERREGIVVRGAKAHISEAPFANEIIVMPCRALKEEDKDYAAAFALKPDTEGLTIILPQEEAVEPGNLFDYPVSACHNPGDALLIFDDVFIPEDRIFMKGEWSYAGPMAYMFANFHRVSADAYKVAELEILVGAAALLAEYNGLEGISHVREKLSWLIYYAEATEVLGMTACENHVVDPDSGLAYPNPMYSNIAKYFYADQFHHALKLMQDIGGGILATIPSSKDYANPETRKFMEKYLGGSRGTPTENRLRAIKLARDISNAWHQVTTIHAEGSLYAQTLSFNMLADWDRYKSAARRAAGIKSDTFHPVYEGLPPYPEWREE